MNTLPCSYQAERGSALIVVLVIAALIAAAFAVFSNLTRFASQAVVHNLNTQKAVYNAQSGYYSALDWLKQPNANLTTAPYSLGSLTDGVTYYLSLQRSTTDSTLISVTATGYFEIPSGYFTDPLGNHAEMGIIDAVVRAISVKDYFAAVPGSLPIANGTNISGGKVYGKNLSFLTGPSTTTVGAAYYLTDPVQPSIAPSFVTFTLSPAYAQKLPQPPRLPQVSPMQDSYFAMASGSPACVLLPNASNACVLTGTWAPTPNPSNVCYCAGDLQLGDASGPLTISGLAVIFVQGMTHIQNSILPATPGVDWMAVASEGDIQIDSPPAPDALTINGTFITDGSMIVQGSNRPLGQLVFNGGIISQNKIALAAYQKSRTYSYVAADPNLRLPFLIEPVSWTIRHGQNY